MKHRAAKATNGDGEGLNIRTLKPTMNKNNVRSGRFRETYLQTNIHTQAGRQTNIQTYKQTERHTDNQTDRRIDRQSDKQADRQIDRQTKKQADFRKKRINAMQVHGGMRPAPAHNPPPPGPAPAQYCQRNTHGTAVADVVSSSQCSDEPR